MADCCYVAPTNVLNLLDPNICSMVLGGIVAFPNETIYRRIAVSTPCNVADFVVETFTGGPTSAFSFTITDGTTNQTVNEGETMTFIGQNGAKVTVSNPDTVTIDGLTTYGSSTPSSPPSVTSQINFYYQVTTNSLYGWNPSSASWQVLISGVAGTGSPTPVADFSLTQRALTASLNAGSSSSTQQGITLTYAWSCSPSSGVTFSNSIGVTTNVTFPSEGQYTITLVVTDSLAHTATVTRTITASRVLHVKGARIDTNGFNTLQAAIDWITTNDSSNASLYTIKIHSPTDDSGTVNITNNAKLAFEPGATINAQLVIGPNAGNSYYWSGVSQNWIAIDYTGSDAIQIPTNTKLYLNNLRISSGTGYYCISNLGNNVTVEMTDVRLSGTGGGFNDTIADAGTTNIYTFTKLSCDTTQTGININKTSTIKFSRFIFTVNAMGIQLQNATGYLHGIYIASDTTGASLLKLLSGCNLKIQNCLIRYTNVSNTSNSNACIYISGSSTVIDLDHTMCDGYSGTGIIIINDITSANLNLAQNYFRGSVASLGFYSTPPSAGSWLLAKLANNTFEGTVTGVTSYATTTSPANNNTFY